MPRVLMTSDIGVDVAAQSAVADRAPSANPTFTGTVTVPDDPYDATTWNGSATVPTKNAIRDKFESLSAGSGLTAEQIIDLIYPVGAIVEFNIATNPGTIFGFGTWTAHGAGRAAVCLDSGQTEFDTVDETGGAKTVTLTGAQSGVAAHTHGVTDPGHTHLTQRYPTATGASSGFTIDTSMSGTLADNTLPTKSNTTGISVNNATPANAAEAHPNLPPYIVIYRWIRTA